MNGDQRVTLVLTRVVALEKAFFCCTGMNCIYVCLCERKKATRALWVVTVAVNRVLRPDYKKRNGDQRVTLVLTRVFALKKAFFAALG